MNNKYVLFHKISNEEYFFFNTFTNARCTITSNSEITKLDDLDQEQINTLKDNQVLFDNEDSVFKMLYSTIKYDRDRMMIVDVGSYDCNLSCVYCFQQNTAHKVSRMTPKERVDLWELMGSHMQTLEYSINLFGGEPFLNPNYTRELLEEARNRNLNITGLSATTNGTLMQNQHIDLINEHKIKNLLITVDGTPIVHDKRRYSKGNEEGSFNLIIKNIRRILTETEANVTLNTVVDSNNYNVYDELVDIIKSEFGEYTKTNSPKLVFAIGLLCHPDGKVDYTKDGIPNSKEYAHMYMKCLKKIYDDELPFISFYPFGNAICTHRRKTDFVLSPEGDVYTCVSGVGIEKFKIVSRNDLENDPVLFFTRMSEQKEVVIADEECVECKYFPICQGGCIYNCHVESLSKECNKTFNDEIIGELMEVISGLEYLDDNTYRKSNRA